MCTFQRHRPDWWSPKPSGCARQRHILVDIGVRLPALVFAELSFVGRHLGDSDGLTVGTNQEVAVFDPARWSSLASFSLPQCFSCRCHGPDLQGHAIFITSYLASHGYLLVLYRPLLFPWRSFHFEKQPCPLLAFHPWLDSSPAGTQLGLLKGSSGDCASRRCSTDQRPTSGSATLNDALQTVPVFLTSDLHLPRPANILFGAIDRPYERI